MPIITLKVESQDQHGNARPAHEGLASGGPAFPVTMTLLDESLQALIDQGHPPPEPVTGLALIDTGATVSCFDIESARRAQLPVVGNAFIGSVTQERQEVPAFAGKILIAGSININLNNGAGANLGAFDGLVALIGRDLLQSALLTYNGPDGSISIAI